MDFRTALLSVRDLNLKVDTLDTSIHLADFVVRITKEAFEDGQHTARVVNDVNYNTLVAACLGTPSILTLVGQSKKIQAIKELRELTGVGLVAAKVAVEDHRVVEAGSLLVNPWGADEPPF